MTAIVLLATRSAGKLRELRPLFGAAGIAVSDLREASLQISIGMIRSNAAEQS